MTLLRFITACALGAGISMGGLACDEGTKPESNVPDAGPLPPPPSPSGTIAYLDLEYVNLPPPFDMLGNGPLAAIGPFAEFMMGVPPVYEEAPGSTFGCKAFELTPEQFTNPGVNIGAVTFTGHGTNWVTPPCVIIPGIGWACPGAMGTGGDIAVVNAEMGVYSLTDPNAGFDGDNEVGRFLSISGADVAGNNGFFFVVGAPAEDTILFFNPNPAGGPEANVPGGYVTIGGFGPAGRDNPIPDDAAVTVSLDAAEDSGLADFTLGPVPFGQSFVLDDESQERISDLPFDGSSFEIGCKGAGGDCNVAFASLLIIDTTDASLAGLPPFLIVPPAEKSVKIFCLSLVETVVVPEEASAFLETSGATRARAVFARVFPLDAFPGEGFTTIVAGHAQAGFTQPE